MGLFEDTLKNIESVDSGLLDSAQAKLDNLTKPRGSLGRLEEFARRMVGISGTLSPSVTKKTIFTFAGDHGVAAEGVSAFPAEVTPQMVLNFLAGGAGINVLSRHAGVDVVVVDVGVNFDFDGAAAETGLVSKKVVNGTGNIRRGPAMTREEAIKCIEVGIELAHARAESGAIFGTGEMGIANTTPASAVVSAITGKDPAEVTGRGTGIDDAAFALKVEVIEDALKVNEPDPADPVDVLSKVGGAEIAAITGLVLGGASRRVPVVIDGFISSAGALAAYSINPKVGDYLFASHLSVERGHAVMLEHMGLRPILDLDLRLGEGTGSALAISLVEAGVKVLTEMATFADAGVTDSE